MTSMMAGATRWALRGLAIAIAVAGAADPAISVSGAKPLRATIVMAVLRDDDGHAGRVRQALIAAAGNLVQFTERGTAGGRLPCAVDEPCVVIADGSVDLTVPLDRVEPTSVIRVGDPTAPHVRVAAASVRPHQALAAAGTVDVEVTGAGVIGRRTGIIIRDDDAIVGSTSVDWKADGTQQVAVPWWPIAEGARRLTVSATIAAGEAAKIDRAVDVGVVVSADRVPVLVFEPRPSWASAFVRRALEADPQFQVESRVRLGPRLSSGTTATRLEAKALDRAALVVVGAPEALGPDEVALLDRYVRVRGGTLVVVPDRAPSGPVLRLLGRQWREQLRSVPEDVGPLRATELLLGEPATSVDTVLGGATDAPALLLTPAGTGRVVVSGAMDAWRYRAVNANAFDRFWRSIAADAASASASLTVAPLNIVATAGERVPVTVRWRSMATASTANVRAVMRCGNGMAEPVRLWPTGEFGVFSGSLAAGSPSTCAIEAAVDDGPSATTGIVVADGPRRGVTATLADLGRAVQETGGLSVKAGDEQQVIRLLTDATSPAPATRPLRPMQSAWWMLPFAAALGGEWWLRRRRGLR